MDINSTSVSWCSPVTTKKGLMLCQCSIATLMQGYNNWHVVSFLRGGSYNAVVQWMLDVNKNVTLLHQEKSAELKGEKYLLNVKENTRIRCDILSKLTIKNTRTTLWYSSHVFFVNVELVLHPLHFLHPLIKSFY